MIRLGSAIVFCCFEDTDPGGWLITMLWHRIQLSKYGPVYASKNGGKRYSLQVFGRLWRF